MDDSKYRLIVDWLENAYHFALWGEWAVVAECMRQANEIDMVEGDEHTHAALTYALFMLKYEYYIKGGRYE